MKSQMRQCQVHELHTSLAAIIKPFVDSDNVLACYELRSELSLSEKTFWLREDRRVYGPSFYACVLTEVRLIEASHSIIAGSGTGKYQDRSNSMLLLDVLNVQESMNQNAGHTSYAVTAWSHGGTWLGFSFTSQQEAQHFANLIRQTIERVKGLSQSTQSISTRLEDRLRELNRLHQDGLISDNEFEQKRTEILNLL